MANQHFMGVDWVNLTVGNDYNAPARYVCDIHLRIELANQGVLDALDAAVANPVLNPATGLWNLQDILLAELHRTGRDNAANAGLVRALVLRPLTKGVDWVNLTAGIDYNSPAPYVCEIHLRVELENAIRLNTLNAAVRHPVMNEKTGLSNVQDILLAELHRTARDNEANVGLVKALVLRYPKGFNPNPSRVRSAKATKKVKVKKKVKAKKSVKAKKNAKAKAKR
jgi:hypothetical protein